MARDYYCPYCKKVTKHFEKNAEERLSCFGKTGEMLGWLLDTTGSYTVAKYIHNSFEWRCSVCGLGTERKHDGTIIGKTWNF